MWRDGAQSISSQMAASRAMITSISRIYYMEDASNLQEKLAGIWMIFASYLSKSLHAIGHQLSLSKYPAAQNLCSVQDFGK